MCYYTWLFRQVPFIGHTPLKVKTMPTQNRTEAEHLHCLYYHGNWNGVQRIFTPGAFNGSRPKSSSAPPSCSCLCDVHGLITEIDIMFLACGKLFERSLCKRRTINQQLECSGFFRNEIITIVQQNNLKYDTINGLLFNG